MQQIFGNWVKELDKQRTRDKGIIDQAGFARHIAELKRRINQGQYAPLERIALHRRLYEHSKLLIRTQSLTAAPAYPPITLTRSETRRTLQRAVRARDLQTWEDAFHQRLQCVSKLSNVAGETWLGLALWSAISRSTLCDPALVKALSDQLLNPDMHFQRSIGGHLALRLVVRVGASAPDPFEPGDHRRYANVQEDDGAKWIHYFVPDGLTLALIQRWLASDRALAERTKTIVSIRRALFGDADPPSNWPELRHLCSDAITLADDRPNAPCSEALGEIARGLCEASGLDDTAHAVCGGYVIKGAHRRVEPARLQASAPEKSDAPNWAVFDRLQLAFARQGNRYPTRADLRILLDPITGLTAPESIELLLVSWFDHLLNDKKLEPSSIATYHRRISARLIGVIDGRALDSLDSTDFELAYREIVDDIRHTATREQVAGRLAQLHAFGRHKPFNLPLLNSPIGGADGMRFVRARHIPSRFLPAINAEIVRLVGGDGALAATIQAGVLLAYRGGLRLGEVAKLRIRDIEASPEKTLFIVENRFGTNKTSSARRQIPFAALLRDDECAAFDLFERRRRRDTADTLLIVDPSTGSAIRDGWLSKTVSLALYQVLGGSGWTFHHLRHAAANNVFLALEGESELANDLGGWTDDEQARVRKAILGDATARQKRYTALATFIGHSSPRVTFESYIHLVEPVMAARRFRQPVQQDLSAYAAAMGLAPSRIVPMKTDVSVAKRVSRQLGSWIAAPEKSRKPTAKRRAVPTPTTKATPPSPADCWATLSVIEHGGMIEEAAKAALTSEAVVATWLENARQLASLRTKYGKSRLFDADRCARAAANPEIRELLLPTMPRSAIQRQDCELMFAHFRELWRGDRKDVGKSTIGHIIVHADPGKAGIPFRRVADLVDFLAAFKGSAFGGNRWYLDVSRMPVAKRAEWVAVLPGGATTSGAANACPSEDEKASRRIGHARLLLQHSDHSRVLGRGGAAKLSSQTLRYVPHMLAIMAGIRGKPEEPGV
jgi:integrase